MDLMLTDKVAVVTGASKGIGLAVTKALADEGAQVIAGARNPAGVAGLDGVTAVAVDLADPAAPGQLVQRAIDDHGRIDVLVNNVGGVRMRLDGFLATSDEEFEWAKMNFFTTLRASRAAVTAMVAQGGGAIVNVASVNAFFQPDGGTIDYGAAKAAVVNLTKSLAPGVRIEGHPRERGFAWPGQHRSVAW
jgi:NAD(P)-dependent dehydrogenase (short-subunit alcohol dehydrogenase family)